ncbi:unnamed protein product [Blepharisma stoltei]|uniref:Cyclic nucleotide-binding domain-containing protein n=1 Tax=Blepharisma stoltei TaxID=1481888 RepID=A0AAU9K515_9CILI|nr:unnamed protein product [Blepharisma stoltei]
MDLELPRAIEILQNKDRTYDDLEWLSRYLYCLEDYRSYAVHLNQVSLLQLCRQMSLEVYEKKETIFQKGDPPNKFFLILTGEVDVFAQHGKDLKLIGKATVGKQLGERGLVRNLPRSLTACASKHTNMIMIPQEDFNRILGVYVFAKLEKARHFVEQFIPHVGKYSHSFKERVAYSLHFDDCKRGDLIISKGDLSEQLYFIFDGEAAITIESGVKYRKNVVKLGVGTCFNEECIFFGQPSSFTIRVSSEYAVIASFKKQDVFSLFPEETIEDLKKNFKLKLQGRNMLIRLASQQEINKVSEQDTNQFKLASKQARDKLLLYIKRNKPSTPRRIVETSRRRYGSFKTKLEFMRDCSPNRVREESPMRAQESPSRYREDSSMSPTNENRSFQEGKLRRRITELSKPSETESFWL